MRPPHKTTTIQDHARMASTSPSSLGNNARETNPALSTRYDKFLTRPRPVMVFPPGLAIADDTVQQQEVEEPAALIERPINESEPDAETPGEEDQTTTALHPTTGRRRRRKRYPPAQPPRKPEKAQKQLGIAFGLSAVVAIAEIVGGAIIGSLAVIADGFHDAFDSLSFGLSLWFVKLAQRKATEKYSFGWDRAEILGSLFSLTWIYITAGAICWEAILRIRSIVLQDPGYKMVEGSFMFVLGVVGLSSDVLLLCIFRGHGHHHGLAGSSHSHSHGGEANGAHGHSHDENLNVTAAYFHALGHALQDIGVLVAAVIIWIFPQAQIVDPIATFIFAFASVVPTFSTLRLIVHILMQGSPAAVPQAKVKEALLEVHAVKQVRDLHIWSLDAETHVVTCRLILDPAFALNLPREVVLDNAKEVLLHRFGISMATIEVDSRLPAETDEGHDHSKDDQEAETDGRVHTTRSWCPSWLRLSSRQENRRVRSSSPSPPTGTTGEDEGLEVV